MLRVYTKPGCVICSVVLPALDAIARRHCLTLQQYGPQPGIPGYPAVHYKDRIFIGEHAPRELAAYIKELSDGSV